MSIKIYNMDVLEGLKRLEDESVDCVMTSPPYYALRDYGVDGQIGLEPTVDEYINKLLDIFDEVKRVLKKDGTTWINLGDTYFTKSGSGFLNDNITGNKADTDYGLTKANELRETPTTPLTKEQSAWLSGLIDGEGCLQVHKQIREHSVPSYQADVSVGMMDKEMVEFAHKITGLGSLTFQKRGVWDWSVRGQEAGKLVTWIYPYLILKKQQAKILYNLCLNLKRKKDGRNTTKENLDFREKLYRLNKKLNQKEINYVDLDEPKRLTNCLKSKCLMGIPERFMLGMIERGWILRNKIIWHKPNHMPTSVKDRFANSWEYLFLFVKNKKYYFDLDAVREAHKVESIERVQKPLKNNPAGQWAFKRDGEIMDSCHPLGKNPDDVIQIPHHPKGDENKGMRLPPQANQPNAFHKMGKNPGDIIYSGLNRNKEGYLIYRPLLPDPGVIINYLRKWKRQHTYSELAKATGLKENSVSHWFSDPDGTHGFSYPTKDDWLKLKEVLGFDNILDKSMLTVDTKPVYVPASPKGKNPSDFWDITTRGYPEAHFAVFPEKLVERPIKTTRKGAVILDIFAGSGTTLKVARDLGRDSIGIEIKKEYCDLIFKRLYNGNMPLNPNEFKLITKEQI